MTKTATNRAAEEHYLVTIVPHTHWDRAWYVPFEEFRLRLVRLTDRVIQILTSDERFRSFVFDGQTIVLEDYLQIQPEREETLKKLVQDNRLHVGPWYVLPDEFLVSGEAIVRNLMIGHDMSGRFGKTMKVGYIPDPFGHIGQMPQILAGFGIDNAVFWRGIDRDNTKLKTEFLWLAPDGTAVLVVWQRDNYGNATWLGYQGPPNEQQFDQKLAIEKIGKAANSLKPHTVANCLLLNNGVDHTEPEPRLPELVRIANETYPELEIEIGSFEDHVAKVRSRVQGEQLQKASGEMIYRYGDMLHGVYSSRVYLKQLNARCETLLERYAEPLGLIAWMMADMTYPREFLHYAWKTLLKNHPHDDICGCSIDAVHREMVNRFDTVRQVGELIVRDGLRAVGNRVQTKAGGQVPFIVFNPLPCERTGIVTGTIELDLSKEQWESFVLRDETGREVPYVTVHRWERRRVEVLRDRKEREVEIQFIADNVPATGYKTFFVTEGKPARSQSKKLKATASSFENEFYRIKIEANGTLRLKDKHKGITYSDLLLFEDGADAGDEYNFSPLPGSKAVTSSGARSRVSIARQGAGFVTYCIKLRLKVPESLSPDRAQRSHVSVSLPIASYVTCRVDSPRIDVVTRVTNLAKDHRLRVLFPTKIDTSVVDVEEHFDVVRRTINLPPPKNGVPPYPTQHQKSFVDLTNGEHGLAILNCGLQEFEIVPGKGKNTIAVTLLRSIGWLSRDDLLTRKGNAGPSLETPDAQCIGTHAFEYAILPHSGNWLKGGVLQHAQALNTPLRLARADFPPAALSRTPDKWQGELVSGKRPKKELPTSLSFLKVQPGSVVLSALKKCDERDSLIVRVYNPTTRKTTARIDTCAPIQRANLLNLNEEILTWLAVTPDGALEIPCRPKEIITVELLYS